MKKTSFLLLLMVSVLAVTSCKKEKAESKSDLAPAIEENLITEAKAFFNSSVVQTGLLNPVHGNGPTWRQKLKKEPLWDRAYIATSEGSSTVVVPLKFDKHGRFTTAYNQSTDLMLEKQTKLVIYKKAGKYVAEVITHIPDSKNGNESSKNYSGIVITDDWAGNSIGKYRIVDGKVFEIKANHDAQSKQDDTKINTEYCYYLGHYDCYTDDGINFTCYLVDEELLGCYLEALHDEFGGDLPGGAIIAQEVELARTVEWNVAVNPMGATGEIKSSERLRGKWYASDPQGGHFTKAFHYSSYCDFCTSAEPNNVWYEIRRTVTALGQTATATVTGNLQYNGQTQQFVGSASWAFQDIF